MSQTKRYFLKISRTISGLRCETYEAEDGEYVTYSDYAALAAENERLKASVRHYVEQDALRKAGEAIHQQRIESGSYNREKNETIKRLTAEVEHLKTRPTLANQYADYAALAAENERLRKAGDVMAAIIRPPAHGPGEWDGEYYAWLDAKEVQS